MGLCPQLTSFDRAWPEWAGFNAAPPVVTRRLRVTLALTPVRPTDPGGWPLLDIGVAHVGGQAFPAALVSGTGAGRAVGRVGVVEGPNHLLVGGAGGPLDDVGAACRWTPPLDPAARPRRQASSRCWWRWRRRIDLE